MILFCGSIYKMGGIGNQLVIILFVPIIILVAMMILSLVHVESSIDSQITQPLSPVNPSEFKSRLKYVYEERPNGAPSLLSKGPTGEAPEFDLYKTTKDVYLDHIELCKEVHRLKEEIDKLKVK